jgi:hypothetical protein
MLSPSVERRNVRISTSRFIDLRSSYAVAGYEENDSTYDYGAGGH